MRRKARFPLMALGLLALLTALWGGLVRLGWVLPPVPLPLSVVHGPLMVCGFLGTLIGVERAVALGAWWPYAAPLCTAVGALALLAGLPAPLFMTLGSLGLVAIFAVIVRRQCILATYRCASWGDLVPWWPGRQWGGLYNALAVLLFLITLASVLLRGGVAKKQGAASS